MNINFQNYTIRFLEIDDLIPYFNLVESNRKRLEDFFTGTVSRTKTFEDTKVFLEEIIEKRKAKLYFPYIIIDNTNNSIIGFFDIKNIDWSIPKAELGGYIDEKYAGKGLIKKAFILFTDRCFKDHGFTKLFLRTHQSNTPARKIAESCGFEVEGIIRRDYKTSAGEIIDLVYYGKLPQGN